MQQTYDSISESRLAPAIRALGGNRCDSFEPHLTSSYYDASNSPQRGKPDFLIERGRGFHFIDTKDGVLNNWYTQQESTIALRKAYGECFGRCGDKLTQSELSTALYSQGFKGQKLAREAAWNHSLFKLLALQAKHGYQRFLVVFERNPTAVDAARYCAAGLVFCTIKTLPDFLQTIELMRYGIYIPFVFKAKKYGFAVTPEISSKALSSADIEFIERSRMISAIAADKRNSAAHRAKNDADFAGGISPF